MWWCWNFHPCRVQAFQFSFFSDLVLVHNSSSMLGKWAQWTHWLSRVNSSGIWLWAVIGTLWGGDAAADSSPGRNSHGSTPHSSLGCVLFHSCHCGWLCQFCHVWILIIMNTLNSLWHTRELFQNNFNSFFFLKEHFSPQCYSFPCLLWIWMGFRSSQ